jgi:hypothetical protein
MFWTLDILSTSDEEPEKELTRNWEKEIDKSQKPKIKVESGKYVHPRLKPGVLSKYRYNTIEAYLKKVFDDMVANGEITSAPEFLKSEILIGGPDWTPKDNASDPKFKEHQYLKAIIKLKPRDPGPLTECLTDLLIGYDYDEVVRKNNSHYCDWGRFEVDANGIKLNTLQKNLINTKLVKC